MARNIAFSANGKAIANLTAQNLQWQSSELPMANVVALHVRLVGGTSLADVVRIRVKASGSTIVDIPPAKLRAMVQRMSPANLVLAATSTFFTIPLNWLTQPTEEMQDLCQAPAGAGLQVEVQFAATAVTGAAVIGWTTTDVAPTMSPVFLSTSMGCPLGSTDFRFNFGAPGVLIGVSIPTRGVGKLKVTAGAVELISLTGPTYLATDAAPGAGFDLINVAQSVNGAVLLATSNGEQFLTVPPIAAPQGSSYITLDTPDVATAGNDWGGNAEEVGIFSLVGSN